VGTQNHCIHGDVTIEEEILDWKPFDYVTIQVQTPMGPFVYMYDFEPLDGGFRTRVTDLMRPTGGPEQEAMMAAGGAEQMASQFVGGMANLVRILEAREEAPSVSPG
jgi:hypothetical protein